MAQPHYQDDMVALHHGDCLDVLRMLPDESIDAVVTDPPYELGFMGKGWDSTGIAYNVDLWRECLRVLKPGGHLAAFGGTRTYHRMACAVEDAGLALRDSLMWVHGQGFPKGKGQLKPAYEPIVLARKPAPAPWLNVDACRTSMSNADREFILKTARPNTAGHAHTGDVMNRPTAPTVNVHDAGRWPSNVLFTHGEDCTDACVPGCPVAELDAQSGITSKKASVTTRARGAAWREMENRADRLGQVAAVDNYGDSGGASRFFPVFRYQAKAPTSERPKIDCVAHSTVKPLALMRWLVRLITPPGGTVLEPFAGSGTTIEAAMLEGFHVIGIEREADYLPLIEHRIARAHAALTTATEQANVQPDGLFDIPA